MEDGDDPRWAITIERKGLTRVAVRSVGKAPCD